MQIIPITGFEPCMQPFFFMSQPVHAVLISCKYHKERIPFRQFVAFRRIQRRIHGHQIPQFIIHAKRPWDEMIHIVLLWKNRLSGKYISYFLYIQNSFFQLTAVAESIRQTDQGAVDPVDIFGQAADTSSGNRFPALRKKLPVPAPEPCWSAALCIPLTPHYGHEWHF